MNAENICLFYKISMKKIIFKNFLLETTIFFLLSCSSVALIVWVIQAVNYLGFVNIENEIHKYDVLVSLSAHEGFSRILLESSFVGLYVISLENSGTKFISELENSKLIANLNINSFKEVLENLQEIELSLSSQNRDLIERNYSSSEIAKRFNNIYKSI